MAATPREARSRAWEAVKAAPEADRHPIYEAEYLPAALAVMRAEGSPTDVLVLPTGTQPYSVALSLALHPAGRVELLCTEDSLSHARRAVELAGLSRDGVRERLVPKAGSAEVYRVVRDLRRDLPDQRMTVDITSGTKAMTAGASAVAGHLVLPQSYVETTAWVGRFGGLEEHHEVPNPLVVFGDDRRLEAERAWRDGRFDVAATTFAELQAAAVPGYLWSGRVALAHAYAAWDRLELGVASRRLAEASAALRRAIPSNAPHDGPLLTAQGRIGDQAVAAQTLNGAFQPKAEPARDAAQATLVIRYLLGRARRAAPDLAALFGYRALELAAQRRLAAHGIDAAAPVYPDAAGLLERYNAVVPEAHRLSALPKKLGLVQGWAVARALPDPVATRLGTRAVDHAEKRNRSIYAHGFARLDEATARRFVDAVEEVGRAVAEADAQPFPARDDLFEPANLGSPP